MNTILSKNIEGHNSKLVILEDNNTVAIIIDGEKIDSLGGTTYKAITSDEWLKHAILESNVRNYLHKKEIRKQSEELAKIFF